MKEFDDFMGPGYPPHGPEGPPCYPDDGYMGPTKPDCSDWTPSA